jgi:serine/threonine protein kinase
VLATEAVLGGRYRLGPIIGRGGGADVFQAEDLETGRPVAVKVLRGVLPDDLHRFEQERRALARLDHPAIVRMCDSGEHEGVPYLVLDLIDGEPLSAVLLRGPLSEADVAKIGAVLADALAHAHEIGVVHRDVKPGNVLFDRGGNVHLTDFGIARLSDVSAITATGLVIGTAAYLAPEQVTGEGAAPASDVYALGLVLLEALTGKRAYEGSASEAALARLHRPPEIPSTTNRSLGALLGAMTAAGPTLRPSAASVAAGLAAQAAPADATAVLPVANDVTAAVPVSAPPPPLPPLPVVPVRYRAPLIAAAIVALVLLLGTVFGSNGGISLPASANTPSTPTTSAAPATAPTTTTTTTTTAPKARKGNGENHGGD